MNDKLSRYQKIKNSIRLKNTEPSEEEWLNENDDKLIYPRPKTDLIGITKVGAGIVVGGGIGLLGGIATIAVTASVAEVIIGGVITKIAGVVGGAAGLGWGLHHIEKRKTQSNGKQNYE